MNFRTRNRNIQIGIDRLVRLKWLEKTARLYMAGNDAPDIKAVLQEELKSAFRSKDIKVRGSLDKTITILMKIWVRPPSELRPFHQEGLKFLSYLPREEQIAIHWGMTMAVYPFWGNVATQVGRLLRLQGTAAASQVQRRVREQYGERETVSRRVRYVLRSFIDWKVLKEASEKGSFKAAHEIAINHDKVISWLAEAVLHTQSNGSAALKSILDSTSLFPFRITPISAERLITLSERLDVLRHGFDQNLIMLRTESLPATKRDKL